MTSQNLKKQIEELAQAVLGSDFSLIQGKVTVTPDETLAYADYTSNLLFLTAKAKNITPDQAFALFQPHLKNISGFPDVTCLNGHLNLKLDTITLLPEATKFPPRQNKQKIIIEYVSANPTGPLTLGNGRGAVIGDLLTQLLRLEGHEVISEYYVNDRGTQIQTLGKAALAILGQLPFEENFYRGQYLEQIVTTHKEKIIELAEAEAIGFFMADKIMTELIKPSLEQFSTRFDNFFSETALYKSGLSEKLLTEFKRRGLVAERESATWLLLTQLGEAKDEVIIRSTGEASYFWSDILYHYDKFFIRQADLVINLLGADHHDHARRLKAVCTKLFEIAPERFQFIVFQFIHLVKGEEIVKMSKRRGTFVTMTDLLEAVGLDAVRFGFLQSGPNQTVQFDLEVAKTQTEQNPIWYLHYASVRLKNILAKAKEQGLEPLDILDSKMWSELSQNESYVLLARKIRQFHDIVFESTSQLRPNLLPQWLLDLAKFIQSFYEKERILSDGQETGDPAFAPRQSSGLQRASKRQEVENKLTFVNLTLETLNRGLELLGISPRDKL